MLPPAHLTLNVISPDLLQGFRGSDRLAHKQLFFSPPFPASFMKDFLHLPESRHWSERWRNPSEGKLRRSCYNSFILDFDRSRCSNQDFQDVSRKLRTWVLPRTSLNKVSPNPIVIASCNYHFFLVFLACRVLVRS